MGEDLVLLQMHELHGNRWAYIAKSLKNRTAESVKIRFKSLCRKTKHMKHIVLQISKGASPAITNMKRQATSFQRATVAAQTHLLTSVQAAQKYPENMVSCGGGDGSQKNSKTGKRDCDSPRNIGPQKKRVVATNGLHQSDSASIVSMLFRTKVDQELRSGRDAAANRNDVAYMLTQLLSGKTHRSADADFKLPSSTDTEVSSNFHIKEPRMEPNAAPVQHVRCAELNSSPGVPTRHSPRKNAGIKAPRIL